MTAAMNIVPTAMEVREMGMFDFPCTFDVRVVKFELFRAAYFMMRQKSDAFAANTIKYKPAAYDVEMVGHDAGFPEQERHPPEWRPEPDIIMHPGNDRMGIKTYISGARPMSASTARRPFHIKPTPTSKLAPGGSGAQPQ